MDKNSTKVNSFNLVIEILMVDRIKRKDGVTLINEFQSRNRDSYG